MTLSMTTLRHDGDDDDDEEEDDDDDDDDDVGIASGSTRLAASWKSIKIYEFVN